MRRSNGLRLTRLGFVTPVLALLALAGKSSAATVAHEGFGDPTFVNSLLAGAGHTPVALTTANVEQGLLASGGYEVFVVSRRSTINSPSTLYMSEVGRFVANGGHVVTEFTGLVMFFSGFNPPILTSAVRNPPLRLVGGLVRSGTFFRTGAPIFFTDPLHALAAGLPSPYSESGGTDHFFWIESPDPELQVVAAIQGNGSSAFPAGMLPCLLAGCKGNSRFVFAGWDWNDTLHINGFNRRLFLNAVAYAAEPCNLAPVANPGGPYVAECAGATTTLALDGNASSDPNGNQLTYEWSADCAGVSFDDPASPTPTLIVEAAAGCAMECFVTLTVSDGSLAASAAALVSVQDTVAPEVWASVTAPGGDWMRLVTFGAQDTCHTAVAAAMLSTGCSMIEITDGQLLDLSRPEFWCDPVNGQAQTFRLLLAAEDECGNSATGVYEWSETPQVRFLRGDADGDGAVDLLDALHVLLYLFQGEPPPACMDAADADDDGEVALRDALYVLHAEHGTVQLPPPYPEPGVDPTEDGLDCGQYPGVAAPPEDGPYYYGTKWQALGAKQKGKG